jgi:hypothetical protein
MLFLMAINHIALSLATQIPNHWSRSPMFNRKKIVGLALSLALLAGSGGAFASQQSEYDQPGASATARHFHPKPR